MNNANSSRILLKYEEIKVLAISECNIFEMVQEAALKLGVLTGEEFDQLVVPEKMIGPSD